jgi:4-amino-4-deoxy-L-arabinose transferase-like glycosyltransferase
MNMTDQSPITHHRSRIARSALLFLGCVLFHIAGTWSLPLIDRDEPRFAEASREMIQRGDYIVPYFNGQLRLDKPPLTYWAQAISFKIFGENDFAARFPSTIAAALIGVALLAWGTRISGERAGWWAALIFTLSLQTLVHAKAAVADMWLVLFFTTAHWAGFELLLQNGKRPTPKAFASRQLNVQGSTLNQGAAASKPPWAIWRSPFLWFYLSLAFGFLAKGPIGWVPLLTVGSTIFVARDLTLLRQFKFVRGTSLMLAVVSLWGVPALIQTHGEFFSVGIGRHVIGRSFGVMEGHGANSLGAYLLLLPFYFVAVFASFFPWSLKLPSLAKTLRRNRDSIDNYLIVGIAIIFIIFTLVKTKLPHYTLPAFPLLAILLARQWAQRETTHFKWIAITTALILGLIALIVPPIVARSFPAYALFQKSRDSLRADMQFGAVDYAEPSLVWYFRSRVKGFMTPLKKKEAAEFMNKDEPRFVILPSALVPKSFPALPSTWRTFSSRGFNIAKGKFVELTLVLKPD